MRSLKLFFLLCILLFERQFAALVHSLKPISFIFVAGTTVAAGETVVHVFRQVYVRRFAGAVSTSIVQRFFLAGEASLL